MFVQDLLAPIDRIETQARLSKPYVNNISICLQNIILIIYIHTHIYDITHTHAQTQTHAHTHAHTHTHIYTYKVTTLEQTKDVLLTRSESFTDISGILFSDMV